MSEGASRAISTDDDSALLWSTCVDRLAQELNVKRLKVSVALNELETQGLIELHRGRISIPALEKLINR